MKCSPSVLGSFLGLLCVATAAAAQPESTRSAADACEAAVADAVSEARGARLADVHFTSTKRSLSPAGDSETAVKGEGRYTGGRAGGAVRAFTYSCAFSAKTGTTSGVLFSETGTDPSAGVAAGRTKAWQPDLTRWSPDACETAAAAALKRKYPRVDQITFNAGSRELHGGANGAGSLEAKGGFVRAPGMSPSAFAFRCDFEPVSGRVLEITTNE